MNSFFTYIIQSEKSNRFYIGHTNNIDERLKRHNAGSVVATRNKGPWTLVYSKSFLSKLEASQWELVIKKKKSRTYILSLIQK